jgi:hypothetical protein
MLIQKRLGVEVTDRQLQRDRERDPVGASASGVSCGLSREPIGVEHTPVIGLIAIAISLRCCWMGEVLLELVVERSVVLLVGCG